MCGSRPSLTAKILGGNPFFQAKQFSAAPIHGLERCDSGRNNRSVAMALRVTLPTCHGTDRQHCPTLTLFEIRTQPPRNPLRRQGAGHRAVFASSMRCLGNDSKARICHMGS